ncbi:VOC family protein [Viridibacillus arvi]|uniref:VOC domain-containing protein n=1 Tax=Viridibacillus arvi TaxID=263475 RepID=A0A0M0LJG4_9BACL|nr:VOC family protein [Viridibacillus arvi]KOO51189.1 hypothetical protein AMD00_01380 [Viridibacillus arvi]
MIERIDTICLQVSNIEKSSNWYQELLGFKEVYKAEGYRVLSVGNSGVPLTIEEGNTSLDNRTYPIFFTKDIKAAHTKLMEHGVDVGELQIDGVNNFFEFYDLDNNKLQVCFWE